MLTVLLTSSRVAPGLLSWPAWELLRSAAVVLAPPGHPLLPALDQAGIGYEFADGEAAGLVPAAREASQDGAGPVVWLAPPGSADAPPGAALLTGSADLPGAHLLDLVVTMDRLRADCPWDAKQTHLSLAPHLLEEPYEALEALESGDMDAFCEELGDVLLQVIFHARIAAGFSVDDVADGIVAKLVRRHPHVFGSVSVADAEEVKRNWDEIKKAEKAERAAASGAAPEFVSVVDGVPFGQPALALAAQLLRRAERAGAPPGLAELGGSDDGEAAAVGAGLFLLVTGARAAGVDPELALRDAARRYRDRVRDWERVSR